jgi:anhydro-N-acetylmuramic acid kinase
MLDNEPYFQQLPPKSTGTEYFNSNWLSAYLSPKFDAANVQATLVELTAVTITRAISQLQAAPSECYICGGGVHNLYLIKRLQQLADCQIRSTDYLGLNPEFVEAVAFAWLARQSLNQRAGNLPGVTQAKNEAILGGIFFK